MDYYADFVVWEMDIRQENHTGYAAIVAESSGFNMVDRKNITISCRKKSDQTWIKWMEWGHKLGCHQKPERSFFIRGYQMPICARCTGVFIGYLIAIFYLPFAKGKETLSKIIAAVGCLTMLTDWSLQALKIKESTNKRRLLSGIAGGFGIMIAWICLLKEFMKNIRKKH